MVDRVILPHERIEANALINRGAQQEDTPTPCAVGLRILVVEDDAISQMLMDKFLLKLGHTPMFAENGAEALKHLQQEQFDLILMDIKMPVMNGVETTQIIRRGDGLIVDPAIPIIALTAYAMKEEVEAFISAGIDSCLAKPIDLNGLKNTLSRFTPSISKK